MIAAKNFKVIVEPFCYKQFSLDSKAVQIEYNMEEFEKKVNEVFSENLLKSGYAPFCKHIFLKNFTETKLGYHHITPENKHLLISEYEARTEKELPVLTRFFPSSIVSPTKALFLDVIIYSREQIEKENKAMGNTNIEGNWEWGIISIKPQNEDHELPMDPITMMRNALGIEHGGSGVGLDKEKYLESVKFWAENARIR